MAGSGSVVEQVALLKCQEFEMFKANLMERRTLIKKRLNGSAKPRHS